MPLFSITRFLAGLVSLAVLAVAVYLLWSWYDGDWVRDAAGGLLREREPWRLGTGVALLAWSAAGRFALLPLLAKAGSPPARATHAAGRTIESPSGSTLYVEQHGPVGAPSVILTHGWGMDSTFWGYAKRDLGDRFRLLLWDLPGLGKSRAGPAGVGLSAFATDLAALVEMSGARPVVLIGHSIGGMTIQTLIQERPELMSRVAGVVLLNTTYTNPLRTMILAKPLLALQKPLIEPMMHLTKWLQPLVWLSNWQSYLSGSTHLALRLGFGRFVTRSQLEHVALLATRISPGVQAQGNLAMLHWDATGVMAGLRAPALVIGGDKDIVTKLEASRAITAAAPRATLEVVQGVNHMGPLERADLYDQMIGDFVLALQPGLHADRAPSRSRSEPGAGDASPPMRPGEPRSPFET